MMRDEEGGGWLVDIVLNGKDWEEWESGLEKECWKWYFVVIFLEGITGMGVLFQLGVG